LLNGVTEIHSPDELPTHFESVYQPGTEMWHLYFDCEEITSIEAVYGNDRDSAFSFPLSAPLGGKRTDKPNKIFPIYSIYALDEEGCRLPYLRLESTYECLDNVTGLYYGDPKEFLNYSG